MDEFPPDEGCFYDVWIKDLLDSYSALDRFSLDHASIRLLI